MPTYLLICVREVKIFSSLAIGRGIDVVVHLFQVLKCPPYWSPSQNLNH